MRDPAVVLGRAVPDRDRLGFGTRQLYTDDEEALFKAQLPIVLNGIVEVVLSGDLQDRSIVLTLPTITEYRSEEALWEEFERQQPRLLGALLDVVSAAMRASSRSSSTDLPRMADFAMWIAAAAPALGWDVDDFMAAYAANRADANETTLGASPLVAPLRAVGNFDGTMTDLLGELVERVTPTIARSKEWPKSPSVLSGALRRLAPNLRRADPPVEIDFDRERARSPPDRPCGRTRMGTQKSVRSVRSVRTGTETRTARTARTAKYVPILIRPACSPRRSTSRLMRSRADEDRGNPARGPGPPGSARVGPT